MGNYLYTFDAFGKTLNISGNWDSCLKDISSWYAMPQMDEVNAPDLSLEITGAGIREMDNFIPLPGNDFKIKSGILTASHDFDYAIYAKDNKHWVDYSGVGRVLIDFDKSVAFSVLCSNAMFPTHQKVLFADYSLDKLLTSKGIYSLHASCASVNGKGIAFTGTSGAGKSTAAFVLMQKGMPILTDERLFVYKSVGYCAGTVSDVIKVRQDAMSKFFAVPDLFHKYDEIAGEHYLKLGSSKKSLWTNSVPLKVLCLLEQTGESKTEVRSVSPTKLVGGLFPVTITSANPQYREAKFRFILDMLENIECRLVKFGTDIDDFVNKIYKLSETM
jgi:hypothetical protein